MSSLIDRRAETAPLPNIAVGVDDLLRQLLEVGAKLDIKNGRLTCQVPSGALGPHLRAGIEHHKERLVALLSKRARNAISAVLATEPVRASAVQEGIWLFQQLNPGNRAYVLTRALDLPKTLDIQVLTRALKTLVKRHEALRTTFAVRDGFCRQIVHDEIELPLESIQVHSLKDVEALSLMRADPQFDLECAPLFRILLLTARDGGRVLVWKTHHIIVDGMSLRILLREMRLLIRAYELGGSSPLKTLPIQYKSFSAWQEEQLGAGDLNAGQAYWHQELAGPLPALSLPYDRLAAKPQLGVAAYSWGLSTDVVAKLKTLASQRRTSLFTVLLAGMYALLNRITSQEDLIIGVPTTGRYHADLQDVVGCFANPVLLRNHVSPRQSFEQLLGQTSSKIRAALSHQYYPLQRLLGELRVTTDGDQFPVTPVLFNMLNFASPQKTMEKGKSHRNLSRDMQPSLDVYIEEHRRGLSFDCHYKSGRFDAATITRIFEEYDLILSDMSQEPKQTLSESLRRLKRTKASEADPWQRQWLQGEVLQGQVNYWKAQLAGAPSLLELPTDRPRPAIQSYRGASLRFGLPKELTVKLHALARENGVTLFMLLAAAFKALLHRYTGQQDICIGTAVANRRRSELEGLIGFFVNALVLRTKVEGEQPFEGLLKRVQETALGAYAHQDLPFEKLVEELNAPRSLSHAPLFQVMLILQNAPRERIESKELSFSAMGSEASVSKLDMICYVSEGRQGLYGSLEYNTDLFDRQTMERLAKHLKVLLEGVCAAPEQKVAKLPLLTEEEKHQLLVEWNATEAPYPKDRTVHELFEEQVQRNPQAVALVFEGEQLSYEELNARANRLAHYLRAQGVGPEVLVGLCVERSVEMVVGLLGILKAGGAYVPLDPAYPQERLAYMLADAAPKVLLTQARLLGSVPAQEGASVLCLDRDWPQIERQSDANPPHHAGPENLVYVLYTSGSTGRPKGVMGTHRIVVNRLQWDLEDPAGDQVYAQKTTVNFIDVLWELFMPLLRGQRACMVAKDAAADPARLIEALASACATRIVLVPSLLRAMLASGKNLEISLPELKYWVCSGEPLEAELARAFRQALPRARLLNLYGASEFWDAACHEVIEQDGRRSVPIGRAISNLRVYVLDESMNSVPVGVRGELHIGGEGLARGYLNRPELTAERFVADPFSETPGARLYKTGDLARYLPDGNLEYLGRMDHQVKIRGFRIELGEIEATLLESPGVSQAVVLAREDAPGDKRLVAYVVPGAGEQVELEALRTNLKKKLPEYMVPAAFVVLESLPLTPNGKIDRKALPAPDGSRQTGKEYVAPRTELEQTLAGIWAEVLKLEKVGVHDNFFELGGHSLLAVQTVSRMRSELKAEYPLRLLFEHPTVGELAGQIEQGEVTQEALLPGIARASREHDLPLSFAQQRLWFLDRYERNSAFYNMPMALRLQGKLDVASLNLAFNELVRRHEALRTVFGEKEGTPYQVIVPALTLELPLEDLSDLDEASRQQETRRLAKEEVAKPFDLAKGPLIRVGLLRLEEQEHVLLLTLHHIVSDGWSMGVLFREVATLYGAFAQGQASPLPELSIQYADYAHWQREWLQGEVLQEQVNYWKGQLAGAPALLELPTDRPRPALQSYRGGLTSISIPPSVIDRSAKVAKDYGTTLFGVLITALNILLCRWSRQSDIVIGTVLAGRTSTELEPLIGCFINFVPLRSRLDSRMSGSELLSKAAHQMLDVYRYGGCPFDKIVESLKTRRVPGRNPIFNVGFLLQNFLRQQKISADLQVTSIPTHTGAAALDLRFIIGESRRSASYDITCEYNADLFDDTTIRELVKAYSETLKRLVESPAASVNSFELPPYLKAQTERAFQRQKKWNIAIASTFTVEPIQEPIKFWMETLQIPTELSLASSGQVLQQLLAPDSVLASNKDGPSIVLLRIQDLAKAPSQYPSVYEYVSALQANADEFIQAVVAFSDRVQRELFLVIGPSSSAVVGLEDIAVALKNVEAQVEEELQHKSLLHVIRPPEVADLYPVSKWEDTEADALAGIPYTSEYFVALGTVISRKLSILRREPYKVIVLDADNTLWRGVSAEDGAAGIEISEAYQNLQKLMKSQVDAGMLLCVCSKNNEADILNVLQARSDMLLQEKHFSSIKANWKSKSENVKALASELGLGLSSFIVVDDNPIECAELRANCPEALVVELPNESERADCLRHIWAFDRLAVTKEASMRAALYKEEQQRKAIKRTATSLPDFLATLELRIEFCQIGGGEIERVSELTQRTNQFNLSTIRRSIAELRKALRSGLLGTAIRVADRFGEYGLTGALLYAVDGAVLRVDTFLLSCRVLGRGVEHRVLGFLSDAARAEKCEVVEFLHIRTARSAPIRDFLLKHFASNATESATQILFRVPLDSIAKASTAVAEATLDEESSDEEVIEASNSNHLLLQIAKAFQTVSSIESAIDSRRGIGMRGEDAYAASRTNLEKTHIPVDVPMPQLRGGTVPLHGRGIPHIEIHRGKWELMLLRTNT